MTLLTAPKLQPHRHCVFEDIVCNSSWDLIRDVQNRFFYIGSVLKKNWFGSEWVRFGYYSCLLLVYWQILQRWLWCHSKQRQVNNVNSILKSLCAKLCFGRFKTFFICTFNASKVTFIHILFEWQIACSFCRKTVWMDVKFLDSSVLKTEFEPNFGFPHIRRFNRSCAVASCFSGV